MRHGNRKQPMKTAHKRSSRSYDFNCFYNRTTPIYLENVGSLIFHKKFTYMIIKRNFNTVVWQDTTAERQQYTNRNIYSHEIRYPTFCLVCSTSIPMIRLLHPIYKNEAPIFCEKASSLCENMNIPFLRKEIWSYNHSKYYHPRYASEHRS